MEQTVRIHDIRCKEVKERIKLMKRISMLLLAVCFLVACGTGEQSGTDGKQSAFPEPTKPYRYEQAIKNGDVVNLHGKISNWERWEQFIKNVDQQKADQVRITSYTTEGDPIFEELVYNGNGIEYAYDDSSAKESTE